MTKVLEHFKEHDPKIYKYIEKVDYDSWFNKKDTVKRPSDYFNSLCRSIIGQQLSGKAASTIYGRFIDLLGRENYNPAQIVEISDQSMRDAGLSWSKIKYINGLAEMILEDQLDLESLNELEDLEVIKELTKIKGIGEWTAEMFLMFTLMREDIFSYGDLGLRKGFQKVYEIENAAKEDIEKVIKKWSPYKTYGSIALWESLEN